MTERLSALFLRSPPFPGVNPAVAAISAQQQPGEQPAPVDDAVLESVAKARVGGCFWGGRPDGIVLVGRQGVPIAPARRAGLEPDAIGLLPCEGVAAKGGQGRPLDEDCDPWTLVQNARSVHAEADDELAVVAGLLGIPVYGPDLQRVPPARLREEARLAIGRARYRNCFADSQSSALEAIAQLGEWRRQIDGSQGIAAASGMAFWKREAISDFLWDGQRSPPFLPPHTGLRLAARQGGALAVWPSRVPPDLPREAAARSVPLVRVEDGFLRSRGLGAALHPPGSVVVDRTGIYYDATRPSDLETLLATHDFPSELLERARLLRAQIKEAGVTKYGPQSGAMIDLPAGRRTVLAVGQVDDDLSVRLGGAGVGGNEDFLARVRRAEPDAWIVYRPHPDVQAGHRKGHLSDSVVLSHADRIDTGAPLMALVEAVDEVHVLSSLTGFEALMRERPVTVHGMPFYAGWGLTRDLARPNTRRGRQLSLDQLVAATLILYPRYIDPVTRLPCGPEWMVERMANGSTPTTTWLIRLRALQGKLRRLMTLSAEYLNG